MEIQGTKERSIGQRVTALFYPGLVIALLRTEQTSLLPGTKKLDSFAFFLKKIIAYRRTF